MKDIERKYDGIVIGGGIFGLYAALLLSSRGAKVALLEREKSIFSRASKINQAVVHRGYHYPRSFETAKKVSDYYYRFCNDFGSSLLPGFKKYYAISNSNSKTTPSDYIDFCEKLNIPLRNIDSSLFFRDSSVSAVFEVEEACFNYLKIKEILLKNLMRNKVDIFYETFPVSGDRANSDYILSLNNTLTKLRAKIVINTTYSSVNEVNKIFGFAGYNLKYELCELLLGELKNISNIGLTVMDGSFFSVMPFADGSLYSLSAVHFTPIDTSCEKAQNLESYIQDYLNKETLCNSNRESIESLARSYLNQDIDFKYKASVFEVKPILASSEHDDARPTLITMHSKKPFYISVLAGKISTIYDLDDTIESIM